MRNIFLAYRTIAMSCTICGQMTLPGVMLCRPCKAALKRARNLTVQEIPRPMMYRAGARRRDRRPEGLLTGADRHSVALPSTTSDRIWRGASAASAGLALLGVMAYVGQGVLVSAESVAAPRTHDAQPRAPAAVRGESQSSERSTLAGVVPPTVSDAAVASPDVGPSSSTAANTRDPPAARAPIGGGRSSTRLVPRSESMPIAPLITSPETETLPAAELRAEVVMPAPPRIQAPDRWQVMQERLSGCARQGGVTAILCDHRARVASCDGQWGRVDQCPLPSENPGGQ